MVTIGHDGRSEILRGLVRREDIPKRKAKKAAGNDAGESEANPSPALSAVLIEDLTAERSAALAASLLGSPDIALAAIVHALASEILLVRGDTALQVRASRQSFHRVEGSKAVARMEACREDWLQKLPATCEDLWTWCLNQPRETLTALLAFCAASTVNAVRTKADRPDCERLRQADMLGAALKLDMSEWFAADAKNYFSRVGKPQILEALQEGRSQPLEPSWAKLKKSELAALAQKELVGKSWLPALLRPAL